MPTPVSWQSAFFALVPMALNVMTQPYGRQILHFRGTGALLLRTSPILNALDSLTLLVQLGLSMVGPAGLPLRRACQRVLQYRLVDDDHDDVGESEAQLLRLQEMRHLTLMRWLVFVLGTGPQAVKLAAFKGTPWTLAWGLMFLGSFVVVEVVTALAAATMLGADPEHRLFDLAYRNNRTVKGVGWAGVMVQLGFLSWAFTDILHLESFWDAPGPRSVAITSLIFLPFVGTVPICITATLLIFVVVPSLARKPLSAAISHILLATPWAGEAAAAVNTAAITIIIVASCTVIPVVVWLCSDPLFVVYMFTLYFLTFLQVFIIFFLVVYVLIWLCLKYRGRLQENLVNFVLEDLAALVSGRLQGYMEFAFLVTCMLANIFTTLIWYHLRYDPTETTRPAWTDKLG